MPKKLTPSQKFVSGLRISVKDKSVGKQANNILKRMNIDIRKGITKASKGMLEDLVKILKQNAPVYTGTLRDSIRLSEVKDKHTDTVVGGKIIYDATQQEQYDNLSYQQRWAIYNKYPNAHNYTTSTQASKNKGNPLAGQETPSGMDFLDVSWKPEEPNETYIHLIRDGKGERWLKGSFSSFYTLSKIKYKDIKGILGKQRVTITPIVNEINRQLGEYGDFVTRQQVRDTAGKLKQAAINARIRKDKRDVAMFRAKRNEFEKASLVEEDRYSYGMPGNLVPLKARMNKKGQMVSVKDQMRFARKRGGTVYVKGNNAYVSWRTKYNMSLSKDKLKAYRNAVDRINYRKKRKRKQSK
jgi:hypothetical protein